MNLFRKIFSRSNPQGSVKQGPQQKRRRHAKIETLEDRHLLTGAMSLQISEIHFDPTFGESEEDQYFELRGPASSTIGDNTYLVVVDGGNDENDNPGVLNSVFDLGGLTLGSNGYLVVAQGGANYSIDAASAVIQGNDGFEGLPGDRFEDNASLSNRFEFIFDSNTFLLVNASQAPVADFDVDQNDDGTIDNVSWTVLDSVSILGTHTGGTVNDIAYGDVVFRAGGNQAQTPSATTVVDLEEVTYVARLSPDGNGIDDWMAGETREVTEDQFDFRVFARSGNEIYREFVGMDLDHLGSANFFSTVSGNRFRDSNGNGVLNSGEPGDPGAAVFLDSNGDGDLGNFLTVAEPDSFVDGTVLTHAFPGVTLTTADDENDILSFAIEAEDDAAASTGTLGFSQGTRRLMMNFNNPVSAIDIDFGAEFSDRRGIIEAYDINGALVDAYQTQVISNTTETMSVSSNQADIVLAVAYADDTISPFGTLDNLRFTQPELSAIADAQGDYEILRIPRQTGAGQAVDVRAVPSPNEAVTSPASGKHAIVLGSPQNFSGLNFGVDSRQPYDIVGRTNTGAWWAALSDGTGFTNSYQTNWSTAVQWSDVSEGRFRGERSETVGRNGGELWVSENSGDVVPKFWGALPHNSGWVDVMVGDFNGDQRSDWAGRHNGEWWVAESQTNDSFLIKKWSTWSNGVTWEDVQVGDFNGDGKDDIAGRANGDWWVAASTGTPFNSTFQTQKWAQWSTGVQWEDVQVGDFNGDGRDDIAGRANGAWWISASTGSTFATDYWGRWSTAVEWEDVQVADFNGDGQSDIAGRADGRWWISRSVDNFFIIESWALWSNSADWVDVVAADFDGNGLDDIAGRANGDWWVALSNGQAFSTQSWGRWSTSVEWTDVQVGQFGDGGNVSGSSVVIDTAGQPGDANRNGKVGFEDFLILSSNYGEDVEVGTDGDVDGDGVVRFADFLLVSANYGT